MSHAKFSVGLFRVFVRGVVVFASCLDAVVSVAEGLPVAFIPEECLVSTVRNDVVNVCGLDISPLPLALHTKWMGGQITLAGLLPATVISAGCCRANLLRVYSFMLLAVPGPERNQCRTSRMLTWSVWSVGYESRLLPVA